MSNFPINTGDKFKLSQETMQAVQGAYNTGGSAIEAAAKQISKERKAESAIDSRRKAAYLKDKLSQTESTAVRDAHEKKKATDVLDVYESKELWDDPDNPYGYGNASKYDDKYDSLRAIQEEHRKERLAESAVDSRRKAAYLKEKLNPPATTAVRDAHEKKVSTEVSDRPSIQSADEKFEEQYRLNRADEEIGQQVQAAQEDEAKRRERNSLLIEGIGTAVNGVAGLVGGLTSYAFPEGQKANQKPDPFKEQRAERLAKANQYYNNIKARNIAFNEYMDRKRKGKLDDIAMREKEARARKAEIEAERANDKIDADINRKKSASDRDDRYVPGGGGGRSGGSGTDHTLDINSHDGSRKFTFKNKEQMDIALKEAYSRVPKREPFFHRDPMKGWLPNGSISDVAKSYAGHADSASDMDFWSILERHSKNPQPKKKKVAYSGAKSDKADNNAGYVDL